MEVPDSILQASKFDLERFWHFFFRDSWPELADDTIWIANCPSWGQLEANLGSFELNLGFARDDIAKNKTCFRELKFYVPKMRVSDSRPRHLGPT